MGQPKAALPLTSSGDSLLRRVLMAFMAAGLPDLVVVTGANAEVVRQAAGRVDRRVTFIHNPRWEAGQLSSLLAGLDGDRMAPIEAALVTLVDVPFVSPDTIRRVVRAWRESGAPIVRPARGDIHGHPVLFDRVLFDELRDADPNVGAKSVVRRHGAEILNVPVDDDGAFLDLDTEDDYRQALGRLRPTASL
jgi:CTP:molybdopterin cytidylyltransferase MocA